MTPDAEIVNVRFFKSVIASKAAFTYAEAQARLDDALVLFSPLMSSSSLEAELSSFFSTAR